MMPGVVAGFPAKPKGVVSITMSGTIAEPAYYVPRYASAVPGAQAVSGAPGELLFVANDQVNAEFWIRIRGGYVSAGALPFSAVEIYGATFSASTIKRLAPNGTSHTTITWVAPWALPDGAYTMIFS